MSTAPVDEEVALYRNRVGRRGTEEEDDDDFTDDDDDDEEFEGDDDEEERQLRVLDDEDDDDDEEGLVEDGAFLSVEWGAREESQREGEGIGRRKGAGICRAGTEPAAATAGLLFLF